MEAAKWRPLHLVSYPPIFLFQFSGKKQPIARKPQDKVYINKHVIDMGFPLGIDPVLGQTSSADHLASWPLECQGTYYLPQRSSITLRPNHPLGQYSLKTVVKKHKKRQGACPCLFSFSGIEDAQLFRRATPAKPISPIPNSNMVAGSGIGFWYGSIGLIFPTYR